MEVSHLINFTNVQAILMVRDTDFWLPAMW